MLAVNNPRNIAKYSNLILKVDSETRRKKLSKKVKVKCIRTKKVHAHMNLEGNPQLVLGMKLSGGNKQIIFHSTSTLLCRKQIVNMIRSES